MVNRVFHLDATRATLDVYNLGWKAYLEQVATDERRRRRERSNAERKVVELRAQADRMRATATKARMAHHLDRRAERLASGLRGARQQDKVAKLRFPAPAACGKTPLTAEGLAKSYGSLEVFAGVDLAIDRGSRVVILGLNGAGKTTLLRVLAGVEAPDAGEVQPGHGLRLGYYAQEHETLDAHRSVFDNVRRPGAADRDRRRAPAPARRVPLRRRPDRSAVPGRCRAGRRRASRSRPSSSRPRTSCCSTSRRTTWTRPAVSRSSHALRTYAGAIVLVTHDPGAVEALSPERVLLMPEGVEDTWSDELGDLVALGLGGAMGAPAVLLVHGFASSVESSWARNGWLDLLADDGRAVVAPDLLGHGQAPKPHDPAAYDALESLVLDAVLAEVGDGDVDAVGFSMGVRLALLIEADRPGTFRRIVAGGLGHNLFARDYDPEPAALAIEGRGEALDPLIRAFATVAATPPNDPLALAACLRRIHRPVAPSDLASVRCPVLVVVGSEDLVVRPVASLVDALPDARLVTVPGVDHLGTMKGFGFMEAAFDFLDVRLG